MQIRQDKYNSIQSKIVQVSGKGADLTLDLKLDINTKKPNVGSSIVGTIIDSNNNPIQGAVVKLMDEGMKPLSNATTDSNGNYAIKFIPVSNVYNMVAIAEGKVLSQANAFTLASAESKTINFVLQTDINATLGAISGVVKDINSNAIYGGIVLLYNIDSGSENLVAISYTDQSGVFVFSELVNGMYKVTFNALGYMQGEISTTVKSGNITTIAKVLYVNPEAANGIVSGVITDANKNPVANADVILYSVENNNSLIPVSFTQTNLVGIYTFINVPSGNYLVKSNQSQLVTVDAITLPTTINTTTIPITTLPTTINATTNPTQITTNLSSNQFNFKGYNWLTIDILQFDIANKKLAVNSTGNQAHQYLPTTLYFGISLYDSNNNLKAAAFLLGNDKGDSFATALNGVSFEYGDYLKLYHNEPWRLELLGPVSGAPINLSSGFNNINLNEVNLYIQPSGLQYVKSLPALNSYTSTGLNTTTINANSGTLSNNAIAVLNNTFVGALGETGGYVTIPVTVSIPGVYKVAIQYLSGDNDRVLQIDVNKKNTGTPYIAAKTDDWTAQSAKILNVLVNLNTISNEIKIYNKPNAKAPWIGNLTFITTTPPNLASNQFSFKGNNWIVIDTLKFDVPNKKIIVSSTGNQAHQYLADNLYFGASLYDSNNNLKAASFLLGKDIGDVFAGNLNGISFEYGDYLRIYHNEPWRLSLSGTVSGATTDLNAGFNNIDLNKVNFYIQPNGVEYVVVSPLVSSGANGNVVTTVNANSGILSNNAIPVLNNTFVGAVGETGGYVATAITVSTSGVYNLSIQYLSGDVDRLLQIDVNGMNTGISYIFSKTADWTSQSAKTMNVMVKLNSGVNNLKFYNKPNAKGPWIGNLTLSFSGESLYFINFGNSQATGNWQTKSGTATVNVSNGKLNVKTTVSMIVDDNSPDIDNGIYEATFKYTSNDANDGRIGLLFRYVDNNNWASICYDLNRWVWRTAAGSGDFGAYLPILQVNKQYKLRLQYTNKTVILIISGEALPDGAITMRQDITELPTAAGKIGFINWFVDKNIEVSEISLSKAQSGNNLVYIQSNLMKVTLDNTFPRIIEYTWISDGLILDGEKEGTQVIEVNGLLYKPDVTSKQIDNKTVSYSINLNSIQVVINMSVYIKNDYTVKLEVTEIKENGSFKVKTLKFPNNNVVSIKSTDNGQIAATINTGAWSKITDEFLSVEKYSIGVFKRAYAIINNNKFVATLGSNTFDAESKCTLTVENRGTYKQATLSSGLFVYRQIFNNVEYMEPLPSFQVSVGRDVNGNGVVDWQDGAILFRESKTPSVGADYIKDSFSYIALNTAGLAQSAFMKTGDLIKRLANYTDGFGQIVLEKGYAGEGHDDAIADIDGHIGIRQGGKDDLNKLIDIANKYNARIGVHINVTEYHLDAFQIKVENLLPGFVKAWNWVDQAYTVDKRKDFLSGEVTKKINNLSKELPGLKWVYVDVYGGESWIAYKLATLLNSKGWMIGTEYSGPFEEQIGWVHWGSDPSYTNEANTSKIVRFIRNGEQDVYLADDLLKASKHVFPSGWIEKHDLEGPNVIEMFYNQNLPSKYMQHFDIMEWVDDGTTGFVKFNNGLQSKRENGNINIYQDNKLIATTPISSLNWRRIGITTLFMPWPWAQLDGKPQRKVYHWNPNGGQTTWDIPNMWSGVTKVKVYKLSAAGRTYVTDVNVVNGKVTINADAKIPYVLFPSDEIVSVSRINTWGEGSLIADPSFDSENITDNWTIQTTATNTNHVSRIKESFDGRLGNYIAMINGNSGANAIISQKINGLTSGRTYTASVWVKLEGDRKVILGVNCNNVISETTINRKTTRVHRTGKWRGDTFTRMRVDFKVPIGVTTATLYFNVTSDSKDSKVYLDEFRLWTNPLNLPVTNKDGYVLYEDFENVDEGFGPFYSTIVYSDIAGYETSARRTHYAEKSPNGGQYICWVIDGRFSFKTNELANNTGELLVTDQSTLQLKTNTKYEIGFKYTCKVDNLYSMVLNSPTAGVLFKVGLAAGKVVGNPEDGASYSREVKTFKYEFTTSGADDYYLALDKAYGFDELILDNMYITEKATSVIAVSDVYISNTNTAMNIGAWKVESGAATISKNNGLLNIATTDSIVVDSNSPVVVNGIYKSTFILDSNEGRIGFIFRYMDINNWVAICYDVNRWVWRMPQDKFGVISTSLPNLEANKQYTITITYKNKDVTIELTGNFLNPKIMPIPVTISELPLNAGKIGLINWFTPKNIQLSDTSFIYDLNPCFEDFNSASTSGDWRVETGTGAISVANGTLNIKTTVGMFIDRKAPTITNGTYKVSFRYSNNASDDGRLGFVFRYVDANNWTAICYDINRWVWRNATTFGVFGTNLPNLQPNMDYTITIQYFDKDVTVTLASSSITDGSITVNGNIPQLVVSNGGEGIISWYADKNLVLDNFSVYSNKILYFQDFNINDSGSNWQNEATSGSATISSAGGNLTIKTVGSMVIDAVSPAVLNGIYKVSFKYTSNDSNDGRIGFLFRYVDVNNWAAICYDVNRWVWRMPKDQYGVISGGLPNLQMNKQYVIAIQFNGNDIIIKLTGEVITGEALAYISVSQLPLNAGKIGLINWFVDKNVVLDYILLQDI